MSKSGHTPLPHIEGVSPNLGMARTSAEFSAHNVGVKLRSHTPAQIWTIQIWSLLEPEGAQLPQIEEKGVT